MNETAKEHIEPVASYSFLESARKVLEKFGDRKPMHYCDITDTALRMGWLRTNGLTPKATMNAQIVTDIHRKKKRGQNSQFVMCGRGFFGLSEWVDLGLFQQINQHNREVKKRLHERLMTLDPSGLEQLVSDLLLKMGFEQIEVTRISGDGGIDIRGTLVVARVVRIKMAVQVKRWEKHVQSPTIQQLRGSLNAHERGLVVTTSDFSKGAKEEAVRSDAHPIALMNGDILLDLLIEHEMGVHRSSPDLFELDEGNFNQPFEDNEKN